MKMMPKISVLPWIKMMMVLWLKANKKWNIRNLSAVFETCRPCQGGVIKPIRNIEANNNEKK